MDNQFIWNCIFSIGMAICGGFIALGNKYLAKIQETFSHQLEHHEKQILNTTVKVDAAQHDIHTFKLYVRDTFVSKEEHVYSTAKLDGKLDTLLGHLHRIDKNVTRIAVMQGVEHDE